MKTLIKVILLLGLSSLAYADYKNVQICNITDDKNTQWIKAFSEAMNS